MAEAPVQRALLAQLHQLPGVYADRVNVLVARGAGGRVVRSAKVGHADVLVVARGRAIAIEVKDVDGRQSPDQRAWQAEWEAAGGIYILARGGEGVREAIALVSKILQAGGR